MLKELIARFRLKEDRQLAKVKQLLVTRDLENSKKEMILLCNKLKNCKAIKPC